MMRKLLIIVLSIVATLSAALFVVACDKNGKPDGRTVYTVTVIGGEGGGKYYENDNVQVTATVPEGKEFLKWTVDGEAVSANETYVFTVTCDTEITAVFTDAIDLAGKKTFTVSVENGTGAGIYASGQNCTVNLVKAESDRNFKGWATDNGEIVSTDASYTFKVSANVNLKAEFNDVRLETPTSDVFKISWRATGSIYLIELDRMGTGTAFTENVDYVLMHIYDSDSAVESVGTFKFVQEENNAAKFTTMDGENEFSGLGNTPGNYFRDWINKNDWYDFIKAVLGDKYNSHANYYVASQLIARNSAEENEVDSYDEEREPAEGEEVEKVLYANSLISPKSANSFCEDTSAVLNKYTVSVVGGKLESGETEYEYVEGEYCTVTAGEAPEGQRFVRWLVNGEEFTRSNPYTFKVTANIAFEAEFAPYGGETVLVSVEGGKVYLAGGDPQTASSNLKTITGEEITLIADQAPAGQKFVYWYYLDEDKNEIKLSEEAEYSLVASQTVKIKAAYKLYYTFTVNYKDINGNTISGLQPEVHDMFINENYSIEATVPEGYGFVEWLDEENNSAGTFWKYAYRAETSRTFTAVLSDELVQLETPDNTGNKMFNYIGWGDSRNTTEFDRQKNPDGSNKTAFAEGVDYVLYHVYDVAGEEVGVFKLKQTEKGGSAQIMTMDETLSIGAGNTPGNYYIDNTSSTVFYGFWKAVMGDNYNKGEKYFFAAQSIGIEKSVYQNSGISVIGTSSVKDGSASTRTLTVENGDGSGRFEEFTLVSVTAPASAEKRFVRWTVDGIEVSTSETYSFKLVGNVTVTAEYINLYTITVSGGKVNGETQTTVEDGTTVTAVPDESVYEFMYWLINGERVETKEYSFAVTANTELRAVFDIKITVSVEGGTVNGETEVRVQSGTEVTLIAGAPVEEGTKFRYWYVTDGIDEVILSESSTYVYAVAEDITVYAKFDVYFTVTLSGGELIGCDGTENGDSIVYEIWSGEVVTLNPVLPEEKGYVKWIIGGEDVVDYNYKLTVTGNVTVTAEFGDLIYLNKLENGNNEMFKYLGYGDGRNTTEFDRLGTDENGDRKTAFTEGVDYVQYYVYNADKTQVLGTFKMVQTVKGGSAQIVTMDGSKQISIGSTPGNYYIDNTGVSTFYGFWKEVLGDNYEAGTTCYFAAQTIAVEHSVYVNGEISVIGTSGITLKEI